MTYIIIEYGLDLFALFCDKNTVLFPFEIGPGRLSW